MNPPALAAEPLDSLARDFLLNYPLDAARRLERMDPGDRPTEMQPIRSDWLMMTIADALPAGAITVNEGLTTTWNLLQFLPFRDRYDFHSFASGGIG